MTSLPDKLNTDDLRITQIKEVIAPNQVHVKFPLTAIAAKNVVNARNAIHKILTKKDDRIIVIVGPCSIHDCIAGVEYSQRLKTIKDELQNDLFIVMRVYFEKPRTTVGWKGLINDPDLDNSFDINKGLHVARKLLLDINSHGVAAATEYLDLITPQYISDLIAWGAIGARTTESQVHRELASGLSCPVGFKNATDGSIGIALDAIGSARSPHHFLSMTKTGQSAIFATTGNADTHIILRGGNGKPNYDAVAVERVATAMQQRNLMPNIMLDFSHGNSLKQYNRQMLVADDVGGQIAGGDTRITGVMIESHLKAGRQDVVPKQKLTYGQSITDACLGWDDTVQLLHKLANKVQKRRKMQEA